MKVEDIRICVKSFLKIRDRRERVGRAIEGIELTKIKYTHGGDIP
jgi:hypothetical protein